MRIVCRGTFGLPGAPEAAVGWFTPEGERAWVEGWDPVYCSGASDEPGAVWTTHGTTWVTTDRTPTRVRYARVAGNGTAGTVEVACTPDGTGTTVTVTYDLTATEPRGEHVLRALEAGYPAMLADWESSISRARG
jgi:hypothetical protein